jgi:hypothetical protein
MALTNHGTTRNVSGLTNEQTRLIKAFLQGAAYTWIKNSPGVPFAARDLVGGINADWNGTPLQALYEKHTNAGKTHDQAFEAAAIDLGWLLKSALADDARFFDVDPTGYASEYVWR